MFVVLLNNLPNFFSAPRDNPNDLIQEGLSIANLIVVICSLIVCIYSVYLLVTSKKLWYNILAGPSFWVMCLFTLYCLSTFWSIFPLGTVFHAVELVGYFIVATFIFSGKGPLKTLYLLMFLQLLFGAVVSLQDAIGGLQAGKFFSFMQSNQFSLYTAVFLLLHYYFHRANISGYIFGSILFIGFGSAGTVAAFLAGMAVYLIYGSPKRTIYLFRVPIVLSIISFEIVFLFFPEYFDGLINILSAVLQKDPQSFYDATGRLEIWKIYSNILIFDYPLGTGFWSDRVLFHEFLGEFAGLWWLPKSAHDGFLSAWVGAGLPAVLCLSLIYISIVKHLKRQVDPIRRVSLSLLVMLFINSLTYPGIGGYFTLWYYVLAAIISLSKS